MTTKTHATKAATLASLQALAKGLQQVLPNGTFTLVSTAYTTASLVQVLEGLIAALAAVDTAQAGTQAALVAWKADNAKQGPIILALKRVLQSMYANAPDTLAALGLKPRKAPAPRTAADKAAAAAKARATRAARGTGGKKQKALVSGNVTGIVITPVTVAPVVAAPTPAQPATAEPATAPVHAAAAPPATVAAPTPPTGHTAQ